MASDGGGITELESELADGADPPPKRSRTTTLPTYDTGFFAVSRPL